MVGDSVRLQSSCCKRCLGPDLLCLQALSILELAQGTLNKVLGGRKMALRTVLDLDQTDTVQH